jgi:hypothetical protein
MATKTTIVLVDDIQGGPATETVQFSVNGTHYEIDLNETNARWFHDATKPYIAAARVVKPGNKPATRNRKRSQEIRTWAVEQGYDLPERGRTPDLIIRAYDEAH